jgi:hypothetical protein
MFESARGRAAALVPLLVTALCPTCPALAAEQPATEPSEAIFIAQIVLLLLVARLLGEIMQRIGQPAVMGQLIAGILQIPPLLGPAS